MARIAYVCASVKRHWKSGSDYVERTHDNCDSYRVARIGCAVSLPPHTSLDSWRNASSVHYARVQSWKLILE